MNGPRHEFASLLGHELHVTLWGDPADKPLVMWHGLARTGRDFDELAQALSDTHFVICPDTFGRGRSSWSQAPETEYSVAHMSEVALALLDHFNIVQTGWLGTSMGGLIGMRIAASEAADRLSYLIINDIGPEVPQDAIERILTYAGDLPDFATHAEAGTWLRSVYAPFGEAPESFWKRLIRSSLRRRGDGRLTLHYDPKVVVQFDASASELTSWDAYSRITRPTHVIAGGKSDILTRSILQRMQSEGPRPKATVFDGCGHAPSLARPKDAALLRSIIADLQTRE